MKTLKFKVIAALAALIITGAACNEISEEPVFTPAALTGAETESVSVLSEAPVTVTEAETEPEPSYVTVSFAAVGDNLIHSSIYKQAEIRAEDGGYDFTYAFENAADLINQADIAILNQETLICNGLYPPSTYPQFNSPPALGDHMIDIGFDVFTIANNHTYDKYEEGLIACLDYWDSKENVVAAGAYRNDEDRDDIRINEVNGVRVSYLSYTEHLNGFVLPDDTELIIGDALDTELMVEEITKASEISDICVVALHWGVENSDVISDSQRETAKILSEVGADVIIGNHPHVLRDIELLTREDGSQTICAYSLGNFISAQSVGQNLIGGALQFNITVPFNGNPDEKAEISDIKLIPIVTHYGADYSDVKIYKFSEYTPELADSHGVKAFGKFSYDYALSVLESNISEEFLVIE